ncbi:Phosphate-specific transport system accessory protein PhoU homolog [Magnetospirillum sp. LM-5]|uniref:phosphate signaling complex protein PhoU n=1 Tax=Magnetospirillum sp. LM-5 TaxID=2681466 RepID=UPI001380CA5D|nr:phosphate signaling complex protein PhoU [Magnetospirillum sp. LM-5]CAA7621764.1 Phosphate-specific transport system accessory protein PhoU homolog [Magnetospirillum sp. LM-5]
MPTVGDHHIVKSYDEQLKRLHDAISRMGGLAERQLELSLKAVETRDDTLAGEVVASDAAIDADEHFVNEQTVRLLALRAPVADDLRTVIASLKIAADLERIADHAANNAKRTLVLNQAAPLAPVRTLLRMGRLVQELLAQVLAAYLQHDAAQALAVRARDQEVDALYSSLFREILTYMMEDPRTITACSHLMFMAKNIERIGDHATNIAEMSYFLITGQSLADQRPKGDRSNTEGLTP